MASLKQIQYRIVNAKNSLAKVDFNINRAEKIKNKTAITRLNQEKGTLNMNLKKLERQLISLKMELIKKKNNPYQYTN